MLKGRIRAGTLGLVAALGMIAFGACTTELLVGEDMATDTDVATATGTSGDGVAQEGPPDPDDGAATSSPDPVGTSGSDATSQAVEEGEATSAEATSGEAESTTTGERDPTTGEPETTDTRGTTTGVPEGCEGQTFELCMQMEMCMWFGVEERGECGLNPCTDPENECLELLFKACLEAPSCAWVGEPEGGECGAIQCVPCEVLSPDECGMVDGCQYIEGEMACVPV